MVMVKSPLVRQIHILELPRDAEAGGEMMPLARLLASALRCQLVVGDFITTHGFHAMNDGFYMVYGISDGNLYDFIRI
jgi:hypothetical protein